MKIKASVTERDRLVGKLWLSRSEASVVLGISISTLGRMIKAGILKPPHIAYVGRRVLISAEVASALPEIVEGRSRSMLMEVQRKGIKAKSE